MPTISSVAVLDSTSLDPWPHSSVYYLGYVYVGSRDTAAPSITRVDATDYSIKTELAMGVNSGIHDMVRSGGYLWAGCHNGLIKKIDIASFTLSNTYPFANTLESICADGTYVFGGGQNGYLAKVVISTGVTSSNTVASGDFHSLKESGLYLYGNDNENYYIRKMLKSTLTLVDSASIGKKITDDMAQSGGYLFGGTEGEAVDSLFKIAESDLSMVSVSPNGMGETYGVFLVGGLILYLCRENDTIYLFDTSLNYLGGHNITGMGSLAQIGELADDGTYLHITTWYPPGIIKLDRAEVLAPPSYLDTSITISHIINKCVAEGAI